MVLDAGASEVHFRIASPPTMWSCFYGVDTPERSKLLAHNMTEDQMAEYLQVNSLRFVSLDGLYRACGKPKGRDVKNPQFCDACFSGDYPITPSDMVSTGRLKMKEPA
jgi:amidophosphoribosyltransferase